MPNNVNNVKKQQWDWCGRCGRQFPMSDLTMQKGLLICKQRCCFENRTVEKRELVIVATLNAGVEQEGIDMRMVDRGFFTGQEEEATF